jgi:hypothetical protein
MLRNPEKRIREMKTAKFQYKCRLCGEIEENPATGEKNALPCLLDAVYKTNTFSTMIGPKPEIMSIHSCKDGNVGVMDLIGYKIYE